MYELAYVRKRGMPLNFYDMDGNPYVHCACNYGHPPFGDAWKTPGNTPRGVGMACVPKTEDLVPTCASPGRHSAHGSLLCEHPAIPSFCPEWASAVCLPPCRCAVAVPPWPSAPLQRPARLSPLPSSVNSQVTTCQGASDGAANKTPLELLPYGPITRYSNFLANFQFVR